jgi:hypothetical protein
MPIVAKLDELGRPAWILLMDPRLHGVVAGRPHGPCIHHRDPRPSCGGLQEIVTLTLTEETGPSLASHSSNLSST